MTTSETDPTKVATFTIALSTLPSDNVSILVRTSNVNEGIVSSNINENRTYTDATTVLFTPNDWHIAQQIFIKGTNDQLDDGNTEYNIILESALSNDPAYNGLKVNDITVTNLAGSGTIPNPTDKGQVLFSSTATLITNESGLGASVDISLDRQPSENVTIQAVISDPAEGILDQSSKFTTFTSSNWQQAISIKVFGVDDDIVDGPKRFTIDFTSASADTAFDGLNIASISVTNQDNEPGTPAAAGVIANPSAGLITSENGLEDSFTVKLASQPAVGTGVNINAAVNNLLATVSPSVISFNDSTTDWNTEKTFTIKGVDDIPALPPGDNPYTIVLSVVSTDSAYAALQPISVAATNQDNDSTASAGVTVTPTSLITTEQAGINHTATFTVQLKTAPAAGENVTISANSGDPSEGSVSTGFVFTELNWQTPDTFTITAADDNIVDGDQTYTISLLVNSSLGISSPYQGIATDPVSVINQDDEIPTVSIGFPNTNVVTSENLTSTTFTVVLDLEPSSDVLITATSLNINEGIVSPTTLTFSPTGANIWNQAQAFTVTGVDDAILDGDKQYDITLTAASSSPYQGAQIPAVQATNVDNEVASTPGINVTPTLGLVTSENGTPVATFEVALNTQPTGDVAITPTSSAPTEGLVTPNNLTFTTVNWATPQQFTITGQNDLVVDGPINYSITMTSMSTDTVYDAIIIDSVSVVNLDNDTVPGLAVSLFIEPAPISIGNSADSGVGATTLQTLGYSPTPTIGQSPGPLIEAIEKQTIVLDLTNDSSFDHLFEAFPVFTAPATLISGASAQYTFSYSTSGIYRYGSSELAARGSGYFGAVVVKPTATSSSAWLNGPSYAQERNWVLTDVDSDWLAPVVLDPALINTAIYNPNYFLINGLNGRAAMDDINTRIEGVVGDVFLIRILNAGQYDQSLHFHGNHFAVISQNGVNETTLTDANIGSAKTATTINVKRNSSAMILYTLKTIGTYPVHVHTPNMQTGNGVYLNGTATSIVIN